MGVALPIYAENVTTAAAASDIDRSRPYPSCRWLEQGLAFNRRSLCACLIVHHGRGFPHLCDYNGGPVDMAAVLAARARIIRQNQAGGEAHGHEACRGCPHLVTRRWPRPRRPVRYLAIAQFSRCNLACNYCFLQTADPSVYSAGFDPYPVLPAIRSLARQGHLDGRLVVDWGGGEPTIYPEFDAVLSFLLSRGATVWVHSNGTRLPKPLRQGLSTKRIHVLCSVDAGTARTFEMIKKRDLLDTVWRNLADYIRLGCRVVLKYIVKEENCSPAELESFVARAVRAGARELILDIDYDRPNPTPPVLQGLATLRRLAVARGMYVRFGSTGAQYHPEIDVAGRLARHRGPDGTAPAALLLRNGAAYLASRARLAARLLRPR